MSKAQWIDGVGFQQALPLWTDACFPCTVVEGDAKCLKGHACMEDAAHVSPVTHVVNR